MWGTDLGNWLGPLHVVLGPTDQPVTTKSGPDIRGVPKRTGSQMKLRKKTRKYVAQMKIDTQ